MQAAQIEFFKISSPVRHFHKHMAGIKKPTRKIESTHQESLSQTQMTKQINTPRHKRAKKTHEAIIINGEDVLLLGHHVAKAAASRVLEGNAIGAGTQNPVNVIAIIELVIEPLGDLDDLGRVAVLDDDEMVRLKEGPPHLEKVEISDGGDDDVELVLEQGGGGGGVFSHGRGRGDAPDSEKGVWEMEGIEHEEGNWERGI